MSENNTYKPLTALFLRWYFLEVPKQIVRGYIAYARAFAEIFPFLFLLRTLLSPWKNIVDRRPMHGIDLKKIAEKLSLGLLARLTGATVRILTILIGLIVEFLVLFAAVLIFTFWIIFPMLLVSALFAILGTL